MLECTASNCLTCPENLCNKCNTQYYLMSDYSCSSLCNTKDGYYVKSNKNRTIWCLCRDYDFFFILIF